MIRILIIEDNQANMELMRYLLVSRGGCSVSTAEDGLQGLQRIHDQSPDLVLCDIQMPVIDGIELIGRVRKDPRILDTLIIAVTAFATDYDRKRILDAGFDGYMTKPITPETFTGEVLAYLRADSTDNRYRGGGSHGKHTNRR